MAEGIRYVRNRGVAIAYQVVGDGETDLVYVPDFVSNLVFGWESPYWRTFYERLAQSFRLIPFDKVHIGARVAATANAGEVIVSGTVRDLVAGSGFMFEDRGRRELKGIAETWQLYAASRDASDFGEERVRV